MQGSSGSTWHMSNHKSFLCLGSRGGQRAGGLRAGHSGSRYCEVRRRHTQHKLPLACLPGPTAAARSSGDTGTMSHGITIEQTGYKPSCRAQAPAGSTWTLAILHPRGHRKDLRPKLRSIRTGRTAVYMLSHSQSHPDTSSPPQGEKELSSPAGPRGFKYPPFACFAMRTICWYHRRSFFALDKEGVTILLSATRSQS